MTGTDQPEPHRAWTVLGAVSAPRRAVVDECGLVTPNLPVTGWSLDWWVGAEDRWHLPQAEASVRQHLAGDVPVVETAMHVPGGDVVHRAYVVHGRPDQVVVEIENRSAVPVALALVVRTGEPGLAGPVPAAESAVELVGADLLVDGALAVRLPTRPAATESCPGAGVGAAAVFPLTHTATLRATVPLASSPAPAVPVTPDRVAPAARVVTGWQTQLRGGPRVSLPDEPLAATVAASRAFLLLAHAGDHLVGASDAAEQVEVLRALDQWGFHAQVAQVLDATAGEPATAAGLVALAAHWRLTRDRELVERLSASLAAGVSRLGRGGRRRTGDAAALETWRAPGLRAAADVLEGTGQLGAAVAVRARADELASRAGAGSGAGAITPPPAPDGWWRPMDELVRARRELVAGDPSALRRLVALVAAAGARRSWPELVRDAPSPDGRAGGDGQHLPTGAAFLGVVRSLLVREVDRNGRHDPQLVVCTLWSPDWIGQGLEVHDLPTAHGTLSFAVRWHGARPALLWELVPHEPGVPPVTLLAPGLDTTWASRDPRGEALLAARPESSGGPLLEEGASFS